MKKYKGILYGLIVGLALGGTVSAVQAVPPVEMGLVERAQLFLRSWFDQCRARRFQGLSGDALLEKLFTESDLRELLNADVASDGRYCWSREDTPCRKMVEFSLKSGVLGNGTSTSSGGPYWYEGTDKDNFHLVDMSLGSRCCWKRMKLFFVDPGLAEDVRSRIELLAGKRGLRVEDIQKGGLKLKGLDDFACWMRERTDEERRKRVGPGTKAIEKSVYENDLPFLPPEMREAIMGDAFKMEDDTEKPDFPDEVLSLMDKAFKKMAK